MIPIADRDDIAYGVLDATDVDDMADLLGETFSAGEPMAVAAGFRREDLAAMVRVFGRAAVAQQVTIVARARNGDLAGALLTDDFGVPPPDGLQAFTQFGPVAAVLEVSRRVTAKDAPSPRANACISQ